LYLLSCFPVATILYATYPGYLSFDSAFQFWQARYDQYFDVAPPLFPWLWHFLLKFSPDTSGIIALILLLYGVSLGAIARYLVPRIGIWASSLFALLAPMCPVLILLLPHLWADVLLAGFLLSGFALMTAAHRSCWWTFCIFVLCMCAASVRHNGLIALPPLLWFWSGTLQFGRGSVDARKSISSDKPGRTNAIVQQMAFRFALVIALLIAIGLGSYMLRSALVEERLDTWAVIPMFDLQAVSVSQNINRFPASLVGPDMKVQELVDAFNPYSATLLFSGTQSGVPNPTISPLTPEQTRELKSAWLALLIDPAYWHHRLRLFRGLLGAHREPGLAGLSDSPRIQPYKDNPSLEFKHSLALSVYRAAVDALRLTPAYSVGWHLLIAAVLIAMSWRVSPRWARECYFALYGSALIYALPYLVIAPSAELRYLLWSAVASWLCILLVLLQVSRLAQLIPAIGNLQKRPHSNQTRSGIPTFKALSPTAVRPSARLKRRQWRIHTASGRSACSWLPGNRWTVGPMQRRSRPGRTGHRVKTARARVSRVMSGFCRRKSAYSPVID